MYIRLYSRAIDKCYRCCTRDAADAHRRWKIIKQAQTNGCAISPSLNRVKSDDCTFMVNQHYLRYNLYNNNGAFSKRRTLSPGDRHWDLFIKQLVEWLILGIQGFYLGKLTKRRRLLNGLLRKRWYSDNEIYARVLLKFKNIASQNWNTRFSYVHSVFKNVVNKIW